MKGTCDACGRPDTELALSFVGGMESWGCVGGCLYPTWTEPEYEHEDKLDDPMNYSDHDPVENL